MTVYKIVPIEIKKKGMEIISERIFYHRSVTIYEKLINIKKSFKGLTNKEMSDEEAQEYLKLFEAKETNMWEYCKTKGLYTSPTCINNEETNIETDELQTD
jgi:hypothetical protein